MCRGDLRSPVCGDPDALRLRLAGTEGVERMGLTSAEIGHVHASHLDWLLLGYSAVTGSYCLGMVGTSGEDSRGHPVRLSAREGRMLGALPG